MACQQQARSTENSQQMALGKCPEPENRRISFSRLLLLTTTKSGETLGEQLVRVSDEHLSEERGANGEVRMWYNGGKLGRFLIDTTEDMAESKRIGFGLATQVAA